MSIGGRQVWGQRIGLISGMGRLPRAVAFAAKKMGFSVTAIALSPVEDDSLKEIADESHSIHVGHLGKIISLLKKLSITDVVMAGKVPKDLLYKHRKKIAPDSRAIKLLHSLKDRSDDTIMKAVIGELEREGIKLLKITTFTRDLMVEEGSLTHKKPTRGEWMDIKFGWDIAKKVGKLDIGQTVIVKDMAVMAVEAIEGTDEAIKRGGKLAGKGAVVVKVSRPKQDMRSDVPVVGLDTLCVMNSVRANVLALEAGKCIIIDKKDFIKGAEEMGIRVIGISHKMRHQI